MPRTSADARTEGMAGMQFSSVTAQFSEGDRMIELRVLVGVAQAPHLRPADDRQQVEMADFQRHGELMNGHDCRISPSVFQTAQILLAEAGPRFHILLCQAFFPTEAGEIPADQLAHIHARKITVYIL